MRGRASWGWACPQLASCFGRRAVAVTVIVEFTARGVSKPLRLSHDRFRLCWYAGGHEVLLVAWLHADELRRRLWR